MDRLGRRACFRAVYLRDSTNTDTMLPHLGAQKPPNPISVLAISNRIPHSAATCGRFHPLCDRPFPRRENITILIWSKATGSWLVFSAIHLSQVRREVSLQSELPHWGNVLTQRGRETRHTHEASSYPGRGSISLTSCTDLLFRCRATVLKVSSLAPLSRQAVRIARSASL